MGGVEIDARSAQEVSANVELQQDQLLPLSTLQNLDDFELAAKKVMTRKGWVYFNSAAESLSSSKANRVDWSKVSLRPRVLRNVGRVSLQTRIMGHDSALPFFIAPAASARLGNEDGELCLVRGAARYNIPFCTSTYSSVAHAELAKCLLEMREGGALLFQLYVPIEKQNAKHLIAEARRLGFKALVVTVDSAVIGKREEDDRYKDELDHAAGVEIPRTSRIAGEAPILRGAHSSTLDWEDLEWIRSAWGDAGPVVLKGIQTTEDAIMAAQIGIDGIYLSNHGGRQLDFAPSALQTLLEIRKFHPGLLQRVEIYVDGGVRRGTDVLKALSLGARAVGLGRPFMYALSAYGTDGVYKAIQREQPTPKLRTETDAKVVLSDEVESCMRLMGVTDLRQLDEFYVNTTALERDLPHRIRGLGSEGTSKL